jgi:hypothetical protein
LHQRHSVRNWNRCTHEQNTHWFTDLDRRLVRLRPIYRAFLEAQADGTNDSRLSAARKFHPWQAPNEGISIMMQLFALTTDPGAWTFGFALIGAAIFVLFPGGGA